MRSALLRRRKLGAGSFRGMKEFMPEGLASFCRADLLRGERFDQVIRWGWTGNLGYSPQMVVNPVEAIHRANSKGTAREELHEQGVRIPLTWYSVPYELPEHGVIIRPNHHAQGRRLWFCRTMSEAQQKMRDLAGLDPYISEYLPKDREYRVYVVQGRVAHVAEKIVEDPSLLAWNHAQGSTFQSIRWSFWPIEGCLQGIKATLALGLDFGGVDVIEYQGVPYVLEVNSAPSLTTPIRQEIFAKCFAQILTNSSKATIPLDLPDEPGWQDVIHPVTRSRSR